MSKIMRLCWVLIVMGVIGVGCTDSAIKVETEVSIQPQIIEYKEVEWTDLLPEDDLQAILNPPNYITDIVDGSVEDQIISQVEGAIALAKDDRYQQALTSVNIIEEMNGQTIKIPGFIVPLQYDEKQNITEFFIVPYFGACIHVPPPPPNQIIYVKYLEGFQLDDWNLPFWFSGTLNASLIENDMATSAYSLTINSIEAYQEY